MLDHQVEPHVEGSNNDLTGSSWYKSRYCASIRDWRSGSSTRSRSSYMHCLPKAKDQIGCLGLPQLFVCRGGAGALCWCVLGWFRVLVLPTVLAGFVVQLLRCWLTSCCGTKHKALQQPTTIAFIYLERW